MRRLPAEVVPRDPGAGPQGRAQRDLGLRPRDRRAGGRSPTSSCSAPRRRARRRSTRTSAGIPGSPGRRGRRSASSTGTGGAVRRGTAGSSRCAHAGTARRRGEPELPLPPARTGARPRARARGASSSRSLRDPVARAYSHYQHEVALGREPLSFEDALAAEPERTRGEDERLRRRPARLQPRVVGSHLRRARALRRAARAVARRLPPRAAARRPHRGPRRAPGRDLRRDPRRSSAPRRTARRVPAHLRPRVCADAPRDPCGARRALRGAEPAARGAARPTARVDRRAACAAESTPSRGRGGRFSHSLSSGGRSSTPRPRSTQMLMSLSVA